MVLCFWFFPKLALGLSGFETGVAVMPLVKQTGNTPEERLRSRISGTRKLLLTAAIIMSVLLMGSSICTVTLISPDSLQEGGAAANRALAFIAHGQSEYAISPLFGPTFGTVFAVGALVTRDVDQYLRGRCGPGC